MRLSPANGAGGRPKARFTVPVLIRELSDGEALEIALIEHQRSDLNAIEEARGYTRLMEQFSYAQTQLARSVGRPQPYRQ
jgi:ParB family chromosome partitioning protein